MKPESKVKALIDQHLLELIILACAIIVIVGIVFIAFRDSFQFITSSEKTVFELNSLSGDVISKDQQTEDFHASVSSLNNQGIQ